MEILQKVGNGRKLIQRSIHLLTESCTDTEDRVPVTLLGGQSASFHMFASSECVLA